MKGKYIQSELPEVLQGDINDILTRADWEQWGNEAAEHFAGKWADSRLKAAQRQQEKDRPLSAAYARRKARHGYPAKPLIRTGQTFDTYFADKGNLEVGAKPLRFWVKSKIPPHLAKTMVYLFNAIRRKKEFVKITTPKITETIAKRMSGGK